MGSEMCIRDSYNTRPWVTFGEGSTVVIDGTNSNDAEAHRKDFNSSDIRFTQNGDALYATVMAWPEDRDELTIRSINSENYPDEVTSVTMLGHDGELSYSQTENGLTVTLPDSSPSPFAQVIKITK